jgi:hypothetical protein
MVGRWEIPELLFLMGTSWNNSANWDLYGGYSIFCWGFETQITEGALPVTLKKIRITSVNPRRASFLVVKPSNESTDSLAISIM